MTDSSTQLELFGGGPSESATSLDPSLTELGRRVPAQVRFGTCSWTFEGWKGEVYHRRYSSRKQFVAEALREYARYPLFRSVEIDRSYYAPLAVKDLAAYAELLPEDFDAGMKVWQELTTMIYPRHAHYRERAGQVNPRFLDPDAFAEHVAAPIEEAFSEHIGPIILSIPPAGGGADPAAFEARLGHFLARAPSGYRYAVEIRDRALLTKRYLAILRDHGAAHVVNFWSRMPPISEQLSQGAITGPFCVSRLMLPHGARYQALKEEWAPFDRIVEEQGEMRADVVALIEAALERAIPIYVYVNNKAEGSSPLTIRALVEGIVQ